MNMMCLAMETVHAWVWVHVSSFPAQVLYSYKKFEESFGGLFICFEDRVLLFV